VTYIIKVEVLELTGQVGISRTRNARQALYASTPFDGDPHDRHEVTMVIADLLDRMYGGTGAPA
jgi:hypothetical protein